MQGQVLGSYLVGARISAGGMGAVYRATHVLIGKPAAVKLLLPEFSSNVEVVGRFFNEARAATAIRHPGIVDIFDFGYAPDGQAYIVMELLEGEPLSRRILRMGALPENEAVALIVRIAGALGAAHGMGIVHRDLKPDNVFLVADPDLPEGERPKLLDFGIAKLAEPSTSGAHTRTGVVIGTPTYMAPEQARGAGQVDHRADLYALGCIFYELLCGRPPFVAEGAGEVIGAHLHVTPQLVHHWQPAVSPAVETVVMRLLAKDPAQRPQSTAELVAELGMATTSKTRRGRVTASPAPASRLPPTRDQTTLSTAASAFISRGGRGKPRWPVVLGGLAIVSLIVIVGAVSMKGDGKDVTHTTTEPTPAAAIPSEAAIPPAHTAPSLTPTTTTTTTTEVVVDAAPTTITVHLAPLPPGAVISLDGAPATPPLTLDPGGKHRLVVRAPGHADFVHELVADRDQTIDVKLRPLPRPRPPARPAAPPAPRPRAGAGSGRIIEDTL